MHWYAVYRDLSFTNIESPDKNIDCLYWIHLIDTGKTHTTSTGRTHHLYKYETFNNNFENFHLEVSGWKAIDINDPGNKNAYSGQLIVSVSDPIGVVRNIYSDTWIPGVIVILERLSKLSKFNSWQMFDFHEKNQKLESENQKLQIKLENLELKIQAFESTHFYSKLVKKLSSLKAGEINPLKTEISSFIKSNNLNRKFYNLWLKDH